ncbi:MAG: hypothetical protein C4520_05640 [Candidatus Abyssobacteria bacterium SURF_5]|uniref:Polymerase/histidinol phosphatase N-terminal domain-containing protein n=1 Tax=Abyssobacteria bacterium (strain SURF_5) TaxID=2093360 RepID=A0A3A4NZC7_ABYX5|nr:MAG: hypothetical protein C4520_05640 [Candidatus Abyssubacteria bacterium SURF_5]
MKSLRRIFKSGVLIEAAMVAFLAFVLSFAGNALADQNILIYFDGHMHTTRSDGSGTVDDIKATAVARGLSAVIITDHCKSLTKAEWDSLVAETAAVSDGAFLALPGFEVTGSDGMFNRDHMLALGVSDPFVGDDAEELCPEEVWTSPENPYGTGPMYPENLTKWVDYIHSKGGVAVYNHPSGMVRTEYGVNCMEVYNQSHVDDVAGYAKLMGYSDEDAWGFGITLNNLTIYGERDINMPVMFPGYEDPIPMRNALYMATYMFSGVGQWLGTPLVPDGSPAVPLNSWDQLLLAYVNGSIDTPIFGLANTDSHNTGDPDSKVGVVKNGVYLRELSAAELYKAIKAGRSFATTGPSLAFDVNGELMGDTAYIFDGCATINLSVNSENPAAILAKIDIIKNGQIWKTIAPMAPAYSATLSDGVTENGYYRVEVTALDLGAGGYSFAWSNPVFVAIP